MLTQEQIQVINEIPVNISVHEQILYLAKHHINLADTGWGTPTEKQQAAIQKGAIALAESKMEGDLVQR